MAQRYCPNEAHLTVTQRVFMWVRKSQWERQREADAA
jgi:hypothetical protein